MSTKTDRPTPQTDEWLAEEQRNPRISGLGPWLGYCQQLERQRDEAREELASMIKGEIDGGDTDECFVMVRVNVPPTGFRIGQTVKVVLPAKEVLG